jgi:phenylalanyl-tRNA synthetase beta chain
MRVPVTWLKDYLSEPADVTSIAAVLTSRGFAVDAIEPQPTPAHIVVGRVETLERHPNADRLHVSVVDVGSEKLQIVTGASNVAAGDRVPIALVGAEVYEHGASDGAGGKTHVIRKSALRGVESVGMMCSSTELALPGDFEDGILILDDDAVIGEDFWKAVRYGDAVLDVDVPSNRPDCLSIIGLAREVAAGLQQRWREPTFPENSGTAPAPLDVEILDPALCRRFVGQGFETQQRRSPMWMTLRLHGSGIRSIDFLIDVSNYAMLETGQPLHFYDAAKVRGGKLIARAARKGEPIATLDGVERALPEGTPVIADADGVVGVAGIFGGQRTGIGPSTTSLFVEAANFAGPAIRRAALALGLRTEGSARHEKNLPLQLPEIGRRAAAKLLVDAGAIPSQVVVAGAQPHAPKSISLRTARANHVLGTALSADEMTRALEPIGFRVEPGSRSGAQATLGVTPPYWRGDVSEEIDVIEEVARATGYDAIPERQITASPQNVDEGNFDQEMLVAQQAAALDYREIVTLPLQGSRTIAAWERSSLPFWKMTVPIVNPLSDEQRFLRPSLLPGLLEIAARSWGRTGERLRIFEIGHVFRPDESEPEHARPPQSTARSLPPSGAYAEHGVLEWPSLTALAVVAGDVRADAIDRELLSVKGEAEELVAMLTGVRGDTRAESRMYFHPGAAGTIVIDDKPVAKFGRLHPRLARAYDLPDRAYAFMLYLENLPKRRPVLPFVALPRFPGTQRDIAVVVDESVSAGDLMRAIRGTNAPAFESVTAFDEYRGPQVPAGKKSVALTIRLRRPDATLTDAEAEASLRVMLAALRDRFGATLRA